MTKEEAEAAKAKDPSMQFVEDSGRGYRRVVASPVPKKIVEASSILNLLDNEFIVIACGGGGIPVVRDEDDHETYHGIPAVIDKDMAGELLAEDCDAEVLFLLTAVEHVAINFGKPNQEELDDITADEAERLADEGQFGKGSMEPKVRAAIKFVRSRPNRVCIIGSLDKAPETMSGESGTRIHN
jgi:carbamate kinase